MGDRLDLNRRNRDEVAKRTRWLVWAESLVILGLLIWVSIEYDDNLFLQAWARTNIGLLSFLLNGTLAGLYVGVLLGYAVAVYAGQGSEEEKILESIKRTSPA